jgi:type IV secretory pathway VirB10-like protein
MKRYQSILMFVALSSMASAQTAMQLFNPAAKEYIYGNTPVASNLVEQALVKFPDDEKLLKLKKLIEEQKQKQDQQNKDQKQKDQKQDQDKNKDQKSQNQQNQQDQQQKQNEDQKQNQADQKPKPDQQQNQQPAQPKQAGEMSPEEAQQLLDAMKQDEQDQRANLKPYLGGPVRVDKDW